MIKLKFININKKYVIVCAIFIIFIICLLYKSIDNSNYLGLFSGMVQVKDKFKIITYDFKNGNYNEIENLNGLEYAGYATMNKTGKTIAYTKWNKNLTNQYIVIEKNSKKIKEYGKETTSKKIGFSNPILFENGKELLCIKTEMKDGFPIEELIIYDISKGKEHIVDKTQIKELMETDCDGNTTYLISQKKLNDFLSSNYAESIPLGEAITSKLFMKYSRPVIDQNKNQIIFAKTLYRNAAMQGDSLMLSSTIWSYDLKNKKKNIYLM